MRGVDMEIQNHALGQTCPLAGSKFEIRKMRCGSRAVFQSGPRIPASPIEIDRYLRPLRSCGAGVRNE